MQTAVISALFVGSHGHSAGFIVCVWASEGGLFYPEAEGHAILIMFLINVIAQVCKMHLQVNLF